MKKLILILGNGFTIDLLAHLEQQKVNIDLTNLFSKGDTVVWPDGSHERGFYRISIVLPCGIWERGQLWTVIPQMN